MVNRVSAERDDFQSVVAASVELDRCQGTTSVVPGRVRIAAALAAADVVHGLKPGLSYELPARLKPCPDTDS
jgi:hypothetical protein